MKSLKPYLLLVRDAFITGQTLAANGGALFC
jgi:hypothetical protein